MRKVNVVLRVLVVKSHAICCTLTPCLLLSSCAGSE